MGVQPLAAAVVGLRVEAEALPREAEGVPPQRLGEERPDVLPPRLGPAQQPAEDYLLQTFRLFPMREQSCAVRDVAIVRDFLLLLWKHVLEMVLRPDPSAHKHLYL